MTIDEMCKWMGYVAQGHIIPIQRCEAIIAALKAGQAMRNGLKVHTTDEPPHRPWATFNPTVSVLSLGAACVAWDAALKGDGK